MLFSFSGLKLPPHHLARRGGLCDYKECQFGVPIWRANFCFPTSPSLSTLPTTIMPLHRIYVPSNLYSDQDKQEWSKEITGFYTKVSSTDVSQSYNFLSADVQCSLPLAQANMPAFYVVVIFVEVPTTNFFIGGLNHQERSKEFKPFVRWTIEHLAAHSKSTEHRKAMMNAIDSAGEKWLKARNYDWEVTVNEPSQELWKIVSCLIKIFARDFILLGKQSLNPTSPSSVSSSHSVFRAESSHPS